MFNGAVVHVIIPAYNEERLLPSVLRDLPPLVDFVTVVDDCSTDGTFSVACESGDSRVRVIKTPVNVGVGGAMCVGYRDALARGSEVIVKMDADGQMSSAYLPALLDALIARRYDYAKGNRFLHATTIRAMPFARVLGNIVLTFLTKAASGYWHIFDPQNGYTAIRIDALRMLNLDRLARRFFFENDMLVQLNIHNCRVVDVPMPAKYASEESHLRITTILVTFPPLLLRRFAYRILHKYVLRDFSPIALFLIIGLPLFIWGLVFGAWLWLETVITGEASPTGRIMLALVPIVLGFQLVLQAIVLDIQETPR